MCHVKHCCCTQAPAQAAAAAGEDEDEEEGAESGRAGPVRRRKLPGRGFGPRRIKQSATSVSREIESTYGSPEQYSAKNRQGRPVGMPPPEGSE